MDYSQKSFKEKRRIWIWLCNVNGAEDNENPFGNQRVEFDDAGHLTIIIQ